MSNASQGKERHKTSTFPYKLWQLIDECIDGAIRWSAAGDSVLIDQKLFCSSISVEKIFKSIQWPSFVRQLNLYGFHKIHPHGHTHAPCVCPCHETTSVCFTHQHFRRWSYDSLSLVTRSRKQSKAGPVKNKNDINGNKSQSVVSNQDECFDFSGSQELLNWNEATVPIGILKEPVSNRELPEPTSDDESNGISVDTSVKIEHLFEIIPIEHRRFYHLESSAHPWNEVTSSKYDEDENLSQSISAVSDDPLALLSNFLGAEGVIVLPAMIPDISDVEIFHVDETEFMDVAIDVEIHDCEDITDGIYSYDQ